MDMVVLGDISPSRYPILAGNRFLVRAIIRDQIEAADITIIRDRLQIHMLMDMGISRTPETIRCRRATNNNTQLLLRVPHGHNTGSRASLSNQHHHHLFFQRLRSKTNIEIE
jgi:hypothetical protein